MQPKYLCSLSLALATSISGCSNKGSSSLSSAIPVSASVGAIAKNFESTRSKAASLSVIADFGKSTWASLQVAPKSISDSDTYQFGDAKFTKIASAYTHSNAALKKLGASYGSVGNYWKAIGFDSHSSITGEDIEAGLHSFKALMDARLAGQNNPLSKEDAVLMAKLAVVDRVINAGHWSGGASLDDGKDNTQPTNLGADKPTDEAASKGETGHGGTGENPGSTKHTYAENLTAIDVVLGSCNNSKNYYARVGITTCEADTTCINTANAAKVACSSASDKSRVSSNDCEQQRKASDDALQTSLNDTTNCPSD